MSLNTKIFKDDCGCDPTPKTKSTKSKSKTKRPPSPWIVFLKQKAIDTGRPYHTLIGDADIKKEYYELKKEGGLTGGSIEFQEPNIIRNQLKKRDKKIQIKKLQKKKKIRKPINENNQFNEQQEIVETQQNQLTSPESILEKFYNDFNKNITNNISEIEDNYKSTYGSLGDDLLTTQQINSIYGTPKDCFNPFMNSLNETSKDIFIFSPLYTTLPFILSTMETNNRTVHINEPIEMVNKFVRERISNNNFMFHSNQDLFELIDEMAKSDCFMLNLKILDASKFSIIFYIISYLKSLKRNNDTHINLITTNLIGDTFESFMDNIDEDTFINGSKLIYNNNITEQVAKEMYKIVASKQLLLTGGAFNDVRVGFDTNVGEILKVIYSGGRVDYAIVDKTNDPEFGKHKGYFISDLTKNPPEYKENRMINTLAGSKKWNIPVSNQEKMELLQNENVKRIYDTLNGNEIVETEPVNRTEEPVNRTEEPVNRASPIDIKTIKEQFFRLYNIKSWKNEGNCSIGNRYKIII